MRIALFLFLMCLVLILVGCIRTYCGAVGDFKKRKSCSIVLKKDRVRWNHNEPRLLVKEYCSKMDVFRVSGDGSGLFNYVQIGDSLYKEANSFTVFVYRKGVEEPKTFNMDFGCKSR